jgi:RHS repeat-associated protein
MSKADQLAGVTSNYAYDQIYQLTQVTQAANTTESYTYDPVGNRTASLGVSSYTNNASNELTSRPGVTYTYDSNGNTLTKVVSSNTTTYAWDYGNRLTSVTLPSSGGTVTFKYDPLGRRIYKSLSSGGTSVFAYDGDNLIEETNSSGTVVARYTQTQNIDEPLAMLRSSTTSYYQADGLGSITSLSNGAGSLAQTYTFDSFGKQTASSGSLVNPFQYTGRELDSETGLYYYRARYYDQTTGRFLGEDPIGFDAGANFYAYVSNRPQNFADALGLSQNDVTRILKQAQNETNQMTKNGQRIDPGPLNNLVSSLQMLVGYKTPNLGCGQQADRVAAALQLPTVPYDDNWTFSVHQWGWHQYGVARSSNPNDPTIIFDPWKNQFFTTPKVTWPLVP